MLCLCTEIFMLIFGIIALVRGRFMLTRATEVRGWPARIIGIFLLLPLPLALLAGFVYAVILAATGQKVEVKPGDMTVLAIETVIVAACLVAAIGVALLFSQPIRKKSARRDDLDVPEDYDERFQTEERYRAEGEDITGGEPRPAPPPDDRIHG